MPHVFRHRLLRLFQFLSLAALAASLVACSGMERQTAPDNKVQFAAGWTEHARPLLFHGMGRDPAYTVWQVPNILPRGAYRVIVRKSGPAGDTAELVDGYRFEIDAPEKDIYLNILANYPSPEALDEKYIVGLDDGLKK
jgi:hypothetical protein